MLSESNSRGYAELGYPAPEVFACHRRLAGFSISERRIPTLALHHDEPALERRFHFLYDADIKFSRSLPREFRELNRLSRASLLTLPGTWTWQTSKPPDLATALARHVRKDGKRTANGICNLICNFLSVQLSNLLDSMFFPKVFGPEAYNALNSKSLGVRLMVGWTYNECG